MILTLLLGGCFGCEQETKPDPDARQTIAAWAMRVGHEVEVVTFSVPVRPAEVTIMRKVNGKVISTETRK